MEPFQLSEPARKLNQEFLPPDVLRHVTSTLTDDEVSGVIQQWMTEGVPYAFRDTPLLYEAIRSWLAARIRLHPKEITLIGSGRLGYSTDLEHFGKAFNEDSDLDFTAISNDLFHNCKKAFERWHRDYRRGKVKASNSNQQYLWENNLELLPKNIKRGFLDPHKIPNHYDWPALISDSLWRVEEKLRVTPSAPQIRRKGVSIRVFGDWTAVAQQMRTNLFNIAL